MIYEFWACKLGGIGIVELSRCREIESMEFCRLPRGRERWCAAFPSNGAFDIDSGIGHLFPQCDGSCRASALLRLRHLLIQNRQLHRLFTQSPVHPIALASICPSAKTEKGSGNLRSGTTHLKRTRSANRGSSDAKARPTTSF